MKNRTIPYGYQIIEGKYQINKQEAIIVQKIFREYIDGHSFKAIADQFTKDKIEYLPSKYNWNKNRIQRILQDERYTGTVILDEIIEKAQFEQAKSIILTKNTQVNCDRNQIFSASIIPILCGNCGHPAIRNWDSRRKNKLLHKCSNSECKSVYSISDNVLWNLTINILTRINTEQENKTDKHIILEIQRLDNEIARDFERLDFDYINLKNKIFQSAALKYQTIRTENSESEIFVKTKSRSHLSIKEIQNIASAIYLVDNEHIHVQLINGQMTGKEKEYDITNTSGAC